MTVAEKSSSIERSELRNIYNSLFDFESKHKVEPYPIHKKVRIESKNLLEWIDTQLDLNDSSRILDAGCGTGNTLFHFNKKYRSTGIGLSISAREIDFANRHGQSRGLQKALSFLCRDFSQSIEDLGSFDLILAIESLKHNKDPFAIIQKFVSQLAPDGKLIILEDFLFADESNRDVEKHKVFWSAPGFVSIKELEKKLTAIGVNYQLTDLTPFVPVKKRWMQDLILKSIKSIKRFYNKTGIGFRNLETYEGAILLEKLYNRKEVGYFCVTVGNN